MAARDVEKGKKSSRYEMHDAPPSFLKEMTIVINTVVSSVVLALHYLYVQASNKCGSIRKTSSTRENSHMPSAAVDTLFSRLQGPMCAHGSA